MDISACPACGTMDIRLESTDIVSHKVVSWRSGESRPVFVASEKVLDSTSTKRVVCVNGHAHPDRVGFDLEWG
jgi:hypothetical protein